MSKNITLSLPDETYKDMKQYADIRWSEVARRAIIDKVALLKEMDKLASKSKLTPKDVREISKSINKATSTHLRNAHRRYERNHLGTDKKRND